MTSLVSSGARVPLGLPAARPAPPTQPRPGVPGEAGERSLNLSMQSQAQTEWCWSAVSTSVALFYSASGGWTQCIVVNDELQQTSCCADGSSSSCNQPWYLDRALRLVGHWKTDFSGKPTFAQVVAEIDGGRPVGVSINWTGGGGHFVAVDGYDVASGMISVKDSMFGDSWVSFSTFPETYQGTGTWAWTYLTTPQAAPNGGANAAAAR